MGSSKKKDKKKKKRHRSSSDEDEYDDDYDKYSSKRNSDSYIVEDSRPKTTLQAIADNYSYEKSDKKQRKKSKYDDIPETEEYVYDQFGEIVQTSRDMSMSPTSSGDEYDYKAKSSKYKEIYEKSAKRKGPATPPPDSPPTKRDKSKKGLKSQVKSSVSSDVASSQPKKDLNLIEDPSEYTKKKDGKQRKDVLGSYAQNKSKETNYISPDYSKKAIPPPPHDSPHDSPPPLPKSSIKKTLYDRDITEANYSNNKPEVAPVKSILKNSKNSYDYNSSDYSNKKDLYNSSDYSRDNTNQTDGGRDVSQNTYSKEVESKNIDYNSADYILKKIREQTKFKPTTDTAVSKSDYTSSYTQKNELQVPSTYQSNYSVKSAADPSYVSTYKDDNLSRKQTEYAEKRNVPSDNVSNQVANNSNYNYSDNTSKFGSASTDYAYKSNTVTDPYAYYGSDYNYDETTVQNNSHKSGTKTATEYPVQHDYGGRESKRTDVYDPRKQHREIDDYPKQKDDYDTTRNQDYSSVGENVHTTRRGEYDSIRDRERDEYASTRDEYAPTREKDEYVATTERDEYGSTKDSEKYGSSRVRDEYDTVEVQDEYGSATYTRKSRGRSPPLPPPPSSKSYDSAPPPPPGVDWPYENPVRSTYDDYEGWGKGDQKDDYYVERASETKVEKTRTALSKQKSEPVKDEPAPTSASSTESLSIEETNKLRAKLGLKPLNVDSASSTVEEKPYAERSDVHAPAGNISEKKHEEKMRERMEAIREKRKINQKLRRVKGLGEEDDPVLDSAAAWVAKSRIQEKEKQMAEKRAQLLEEMDEEFGVTQIMAKSILKKKSKYDEYNSSNLHGFKVEHRASDLAAANQTILTLKDKDVLDEDEDILYNVNVQETEKARINLKNKKKRPGYQAYDEFDEETGEFKMRTVLDKYDEEIEGQKRDSFRINTDGTADTTGENHIEKIRAILKSQQVSLASVEMQPARDYFTSEEMVSFKKPGKKKRKVRKREVLKADDLLKMEVVDSNKDRGSRKLKSALKNSNKVFEEEIDTSNDMDIVPAEVDELDYFVAVNQHMEEEPLLDDDEAEQELQIALQRSRRAKLKTNLRVIDENTIVENVAKEVLSKPHLKEEENEVVSTKVKKKAKGAIVLDSTSEFCRTLGDIPTLSTFLAPEAEENTEEDMDIEEPEASATTATTSGWEQVEMTEGTSVAEDNDDNDDDVLEAEPIPTGLAATLNLANMKGYLKDGKEKIRKFDPLNLPETKAEVDIEKLRDEEKNKYTRGYERERDRDRYDPYAWKEKANYKPDIKLEYVDNKGRHMNQKEAFRLLSHKFHGKGSGKLKTEKRSKKLLDEKKLQMMSSIDTPLNTAALFKDKQKQSQSAYLVLSGGGKNILSGETLKK